MEKGGGMELYKFHVLYCSFGTVHHSNAVSRSYQWIGCIAVYRFASACCHYSYFGQERIHFSCFLIQYVSTETFDAWCMAGDNNSQMMLGNDFYRIVICKYGNIGMGFYRFYQASLYFSSCIVFVVQDAELGMSSFFVEVEFSIFFFIKIHSPFYQFLDLCRCFSHYFFYSRAVTDPIAGNHRVFNVFLEIVYFQVGNRCYTSLSKIGIGFFQSCFTNQGDFTFVSYFQCEAHSGKS